MYHQTHQYRTAGTEEPTAPLGTQYQNRNLRLESKSWTKELPHPNIISQQHEHSLRNQYERQLQICHSQIEVLKEQIQQEETKNSALEDTIKLLTKQRNSANNDNRNLFKSNQNNRQLVQKLKIDNHSKEMEINKFKGERKIYHQNVSNIELKIKDLKDQLHSKNARIEQITIKSKKYQRNDFESRIKIEDFERTLNQNELQKQELRQELKNTLQKYLGNENVLSKLEYQLKQVNELNTSMKDRIYELEKQRDELLLKLGYDISSSKANLSDSIRSNIPTNQKSMIQIQTYMKQVGDLLDLKRNDSDQRTRNYEKLKLSIQCLESNV